MDLLNLLQFQKDQDDIVCYIKVFYINILKNNIIYVPDPKIAQQKEKENEKENAIKEKLFNLYKRGKLTTKE